MTILLKKKKNDVIRKVKVKMACNCHVACVCECTSPSAFVAPHVETEAAWSLAKHNNVSGIVTE